MEQTELETILKKHLAWLRSEPDGVCAYLSGADLRDADGAPDVLRARAGTHETGA